MKKVLTSAVIVFSLSTLSAQTPVNLTGAWTFTVQTSAGSGTPAVTLKQEGEKLSGHYSSTQLGEAELTGTVKGAAVTFAFIASVQGAQLNVTYTGTIESKDSMKGQVNLVGLGEGTFTAKRQP